MSDSLYDVLENGIVLGSYASLIEAALIWKQRPMHRQVWSNAPTANGWDTAYQISAEELQETLQDGSAPDYSHGS